MAKRVTSLAQPALRRNAWTRTSSSSVSEVGKCEAFLILFLNYPTHALPTHGLEYNCELAALIEEESREIEPGQELGREPEESSDDGMESEDGSKEESELEDEETFKAKLILIYTMIEDQLAIKMELQAVLRQIKEESQKWIPEMKIALEDHSNLGSEGNKEEEKEEAYLGTLAGEYQRARELSHKHQNDIQTLLYDIELWEQNVAKAIQQGGH